MFSTLFEKFRAAAPLAKRVPFPTAIAATALVATVVGNQAKAQDAAQLNNSELNRITEQYRIPVVGAYRPAAFGAYANTIRKPVKPPRPNRFFEAATSPAASTGSNNLLTIYFFLPDGSQFAAHVRDGKVTASAAYGPRKDRISLSPTVMADLIKRASLKMASGREIISAEELATMNQPTQMPAVNVPNQTPQPSGSYVNIVYDLDNGSTYSANVQTDGQITPRVFSAAGAQANLTAEEMAALNRNALQDASVKKTNARSHISAAELAAMVQITLAKMTSSPTSTQMASLHPATDARIIDSPNANIGLGQAFADDVGPLSFESCSALILSIGSKYASNFSLHHAEGIAAGLRGESDCGAHVLQIVSRKHSGYADPNLGKGAAQFGVVERSAFLETYGHSVMEGTLGEQINFIIQRMQQSGSLDLLLRQTTREGALRAFVEDYLRPKSTELAIEVYSEKSFGSGSNFARNGLYGRHASIVTPMAVVASLSGGHVERGQLVAACDIPLCVAPMIKNALRRYRVAPGIEAIAARPS